MILQQISLNELVITRLKIRVDGWTGVRLGPGGHGARRGDAARSRSLRHRRTVDT